MTIQDLYTSIEQGEYSVNYEVPTESYWKRNHVVDVTKSIEWNQDQVKQHNADIDAIYLRNRNQQQAMDDRFRHDCIVVIKDALIMYRCSEDICNVIFQKAWNDGHSEGYYGVAHYMVEYIELVDEVLKHYSSLRLSES